MQSRELDLDGVSRMTSRPTLTRTNVGGNVHVRTIAVVLCLALWPAFSSAAVTAPPAPITNLTNAVIRASNTDDASGLAKLFTVDAVVVDENPPFVWRGAGAGVAWWRIVDQVLQNHKMTHFKASGVRISEFLQAGTDAYLVQPLTLTGIAGGKPFAESGTLTYTFHDAGGTWLISTLVWSTKP
jgi:ketosteroid isomerase-like protein